MKNLLRETLRWVVIAAAGGVGIKAAWAEGWHIVTGWNGDWLGAAVSLLFILVLAGLPLTVAYIVLRRQYGKLFVLLGMVGAAVLFVFLNAMIEQSGAFQFFERRIPDSFYAVLTIPFILLMFLGPIYVAAGFFRLCLRLARKISPGTPHARFAEDSSHRLARRLRAVGNGSAADGRNDSHLQPPRPIAQRNRLSRMGCRFHAVDGCDRDDRRVVDVPRTVAPSASSCCRYGKDCQ